MEDNIQAQQTVEIDLKPQDERGSRRVISGEPKVRTAREVTSGDMAHRLDRTTGH